MGGSVVLRSTVLAFALAAGTLVACAQEQPLRVVREDPTNLPLRGLSAEEQAAFDRGDVLFERVYRETQGLGPLYIRASCASCHQDDAKGPGFVTRMAVVEADGITASSDQSALLWGSVVRRQLAAGATRPIEPPDSPDLRVLTSVRFGPAVFGRGWIDAVDGAEIERIEALQSRPGSPVSGRINRLADGSIGRFGVKARVATLELFTADAFRGDMGLTSPIYSEELPNPDGLTDDRLPGVDLSMDTIADVAAYVRMLAIPRREGLSDAGRALFESTGCASCHVPSLRTRADYPVAALAGADAEIYSDLLLHDMGSALADGVREGSATEREWRTAPLMGLRHLRNYLHDGRAATIEEAVRLHRGEGSEANASVDAFEALAPTERATLLDFLGRL